MTNKVDIKKIDVSKFKLINENLKFKKNVNALINEETKEIPEEKKNIIISILKNLQVKNDVRVKKLLDRFKSKHEDLNLEKSKKIVDDFEKIDNEIVKFDEDEIKTLSNTKIQNKFADLKANLADTNISLLEKDMEKEDELKQLEFDFDTLYKKIKTVNNILDFSYKEPINKLNKKYGLKKNNNLIDYKSLYNNDSINTTCSNETLKKSYMNHQSDTYFSKYYKYKIKYINLKKIINQL